MIFTSLSSGVASCRPKDVFPIEFCRVGLCSASAQLAFCERVLAFWKLVGYVSRSGKER